MNSQIEERLAAMILRLNAFDDQLDLLSDEVEELKTLNTELTQRIEQLESENGTHSESGSDPL